MAMSSAVWLVATCLLVCTAPIWAVGGLGRSFEAFFLLTSFLLLYVMFGFEEVSIWGAVVWGSLFFVLRFVVGAVPLDGGIAAGLQTLAWATGAYFLGRLLAQVVSRPIFLLPVAVAVTVLEAGNFLPGPHWSLAAGGWIGAPGAVWAAAGPAAGTPAADPVLSGPGLGDLVLLAYLLAITVRFRFSLRRTVIALMVGFAACALVAHVIQGRLLAVPFECMAFVVAYLPRPAALQLLKGQATEIPDPNVPSV